MKHQSHFNSEEHHRHEVGQQSQQRSGVEFATVEDLLRYDARHTKAPPGVAQRLQASVGRGPETPDSWWRRIFRK